jgi:hypothetical protein
VPPAHADSKLEVLGGGDSRTVNLQACTARTSAADKPFDNPPVGNCPDKGARPPYLVGQTTIFVRNTSGKSASLCISYIAEGSTHEIRLPSNSDWVFIEGMGLLSEGPLSDPLKEGEVRSLRLRFELPPGKPQSTVNGDLALELGGETTIVPIAGEMREFKGVAVEPKTLELDSDQNSAVLTLTGSEVVDFLRSRGFGSASAKLRDGGGDTTQVTVELPQADQIAASDNPDRAQLTVTMPDGDPPPGKYTGTLSLSDQAPAAPSVDVVLNSHRSLLVLVGLAFLGVLFGGLLTRLITLAMRRSLLLKVLGQSMTAYAHIVGFGETRSWRLADLLDGSLDSPPPEDRLQGVPALIASIKGARSSRDLDEDADRVLDTIARIQRWLRVEPAARHLALVEEEDSPKEDLNVSDDPAAGAATDHPWRESQTWRDTQILLGLARYEPLTPADADDLVERLLWQADWHHRFATAWGAAVEHANRPELAKRLWEIDKSLNAGTDATVTSRTPEQQAAGDALLTAFFEEKLASLGVEPTPTPKPADPEEKFGVTPVRWKASPNLFTGWATLDAQSYGQLARRTVTSARAIAWPSIKTEILALTWTDAGWTLVSLGIASFAYGFQGYSDTWGTCEDMAKAFLAGAGGSFVVDWAALPIFQSIRLRSSKASSGSEAAAT